MGLCHFDLCASRRGRLPHSCTPSFPNGNSILILAEGREGVDSLPKAQALFEQAQHVLVRRAQR